MPRSRFARVSHERSGAFSNYRDWRAFLAAVQAPSAYLSVATALKAGHEWLTGSRLDRTRDDRARADPGSETCSWLLADSGLVSRKTLGV